MYSHRKILSLHPVVTSNEFRLNVSACLSYGNCRSAVECLTLYIQSTIYCVSPGTNKGITLQTCVYGGLKRSQVILPCGSVVATPGNVGSVTTKINHKEENTNTLHVRSINFMFMLLSKRRNRSRWPEYHNVHN